MKKKDEIIAKLLQDIENNKISQLKEDKRLQEEQDIMYAKQLQEQLSSNEKPVYHEEQDLIFAKKLQEQLSSNEKPIYHEKPMISHEEPMISHEEEIFLRLEQERIEQQLKMEQQSFEDELFAKKLMENEKLLIKDEQMVKSIVDRERFIYPNPKLVKGRDYDFPREKRQHSISVHNKYCNCFEVQLWNNNHIFQIHSINCGCDDGINYYNDRKGAWKKNHSHVNCCNKNHFHSIECPCSYRR